MALKTGYVRPTSPEKIKYEAEVKELAAAQADDPSAFYDIEVAIPKDATDADRETLVKAAKLAFQRSARVAVDKTARVIFTESKPLVETIAFQLYAKIERTPAEVATEEGE